MKPFNAIAAIDRVFLVSFGVEQATSRHLARWRHHYDIYTMCLCVVQIYVCV